jgi:ATP-dependent Clp protease ATP-binding subunit ClpC
MCVSWGDRYSRSKSANGNERPFLKLLLTFNTRQTKYIAIHGIREANMNDALNTQLKILVERAVRPVRAGLARKKKMREELLAHVSNVFEEEFKLGDETAALTRTRERFGPPAELTRQLQGTVPVMDRAAFVIESFVGCPSHENVWRRAARYAVMTLVLATFCLTILMLALTSAEEWLTVARLPSVLGPLWMACLTFSATLLEHGMRQALFGKRGRNWPRALAVGVAAWLLVPALVLVWLIALTGGFQLSVLEIWPLLVSSLLSPLALMLVVYVCLADIRYLEEWANLSIE